MTPISLNKIVAVAIGSVVVVAALVAVTYFLFLKYSVQPSDSPTARIDLTNQYQATEQLIDRAEYDQALVVIDRMINEASTVNGVAYWQLKKANVLFAKGGSDNMAQAVSILSAIAADPLLENSFHGWAIVGLLRFYYFSYSPDILLAIKHVPLLDAEQSGDSEVLFKAAQVADEIRPLSLGKLFLAFPAAVRLIYDDSLAKDRKEEYARGIQTFVDQSIELQKTEESWFNAPGDVMLADHYRGLLLSAAASGGADPALAAVYFDRALEMAKTDSSPVTIALALYTRLYYAGHLLRYDLPGADGVITDLLTAAADLDSDSLFVSFARAANANPDSYNYALFSEIASHDPAFKNFWHKKFELDF